MLITTVTLKLFKPGNKAFNTQLVKAKKGTHFTAANIDDVVLEFMGKVDAAMPDRYRMVQVGAATFNFVRVELEDGPPPTLEPEVATP